MLAEEVPDAFVAFGFQKFAWVEANVLFGGEFVTADVVNAKNPDNNKNWKLNLELMILVETRDWIARRISGADTETENVYACGHVSVGFRGVDKFFGFCVE